VDRLAHGAHHHAPRVGPEQRGYVGLGEQGFDGRQPAARIGGEGGAHGGFVESRGARVVSRGAGLGTGTVSTPWASAATAPFRLVASRTRIRYFLPGSSGCAVWTTIRSDGTGRCFRSCRTLAVSTRGVVDWIRNAMESTGSTLRMCGPTVSCANTHSTAPALESTAMVIESNGSRRSSWRLLFWSWIAHTR